jgi:hypothetical protein
MLVLMSILDSHFNMCTRAIEWHFSFTAVSSLPDVALGFAFFLVLLISYICCLVQISLKASLNSLLNLALTPLISP